MLVGAPDDVLRLLFRLVEDVPAELLDVGKFFLVLVGDLLEGLVRRADLLEFLVEGLAVPGDLPEVPFDADELFPGSVLRILYDLFGKAHLPGQFEGEGIARETDFELEHRLDFLGVEEHGPVDDPRLRPGCVEFEVGIVGRDDPVGPAGVQGGEDRFGDGPAGGWFRSGPELVDQHEGLSVGLGEHGPHVGEEGAIGREVVVDRLVVPDRDHDPVEDRQFGGLRGRDQHAPLEHVLQQSGGLEADGLAAGVRA